MQKLSAVETLQYMIDMLTYSLLELEDCEEPNDFTYGEKTAYVECMEWLQSWEEAAKNGLDYEIESRFVL